MLRFLTTCLLFACTLGPLTFDGLLGQGPAQWRVSAVPEVRIGEFGGPDEDFLVNPRSGHLLSDGTLVIQNSTRGLMEIRFYDPSGSDFRNVTRWGLGPFEFHYLLGMNPIAGDSTIAVGEDGRFAVFGPNGQQSREGRTGLRPVLPVVGTRAIDETHLSMVKLALPAGPPPPGTYREPYAVLVHNLQSQETDTVSSLFGMALSVRSAGGRTTAYPVPFGPEAFVAAGGGMLWVGDSSLPRVIGYKPGQPTPEVVVELPFEPREVTRDDRRHLREVFSNVFSGDTQVRWARYASSMDFPSVMPFFGKLEVDRAGNLWVQHYEPLRSTGPQRWEVFSRRGEHIASVEVPEAAIADCSRAPTHGCGLLKGILDIGEDYMLVSQRDELDVPSVAKFRIQKGP